jgi:hypothetical protein
MALHLSERYPVPACASLSMIDDPTGCPSSFQKQLHLPCIRPRGPGSGIVEHGPDVVAVLMTHADPQPFADRVFLICGPVCAGRPVEPY